jgi:hypothetical protein
MLEEILTNMMTEEDHTRYTAPRSIPKHGLQYSKAEVMEYVKSCFSSEKFDYSIHEISSILKMAADILLDDVYGIEENH